MEQYITDPVSLESLVENFRVAKEEYEYFVDHNWAADGPCGGNEDCKHCKKSFYTKRGLYLRAYLELYKQDRNSCPKLNWVYLSTSDEAIAGQFHASKCSKNMLIANCPCQLAMFMKVAYPGITETTTLRSFKSQIYPNFVKMIPQ